MGLKSRNFTGTLRAAVLRVLGTDSLSKVELLARLRKIPAAKQIATEQVSIRRLQLALRRLLAQNKITQIGQRAKARFQAK